MLGLDAAKRARRVHQGFFPAHLAPRVGDLLAHHGGGDAVFVRGVAPGKTAFHTRMAFVGLAVFPGHHADDFAALHLRLEAAAHAAVGAGGGHAVLGLAQHDDFFLFERGRGAGLHAGAAAHAVRLHETAALPRRDARFKAAPGDGQRKSALGLFTRAHAAVAHNALGRVVGEIGVRLVFFVVEVIGALKPVAHVAQAHHTGLGLQLAVAVGGAGQAVERVVRDIQLHHALAQVLQLGRLGAYLHAGLGRGSARGRVALAPFNFDQAQAARAKGLQAVGGAQFGHLDARIHGGAHERGAARHGDLGAVDLQRDKFGRCAGGRAVVDFSVLAQHGCPLRSRSQFLHGALQRRRCMAPTRPPTRAPAQGPPRRAGSVPLPAARSAARAGGRSEAT